MTDGTNCLAEVKRRCMSAADMKLCHSVVNDLTFCLHNAISYQRPMSVCIFTYYWYESVALVINFVKTVD